MMNFIKGVPIAQLDHNNFIFMDEEISDESSESESEEILNLTVIIDSLKSGQKECPLCHKSFSCKDNLRRHVGTSCPIAKAKNIIRE